MTKLIAPVLALLLLAACAPIRGGDPLSQPGAPDLAPYVGGVR